MYLKKKPKKNNLNHLILLLFSLLFANERNNFRKKWNYQTMIYTKSVYEKSQRLRYGRSDCFLKAEIDAARHANRSANGSPDNRSLHFNQRKLAARMQWAKPRLFFLNITGSAWWMGGFFQHWIKPFFQVFNYALRNLLCMRDNCTRRDIRIG